MHVASWLLLPAPALPWEHPHNLDVPWMKCPGFWGPCVGSKSTKLLLAVHDVLDSVLLVSSSWVLSSCWSVLCRFVGYVYLCWCNVRHATLWCVWVYRLLLASGSSIHSQRGEQIIPLHSGRWVWFMRAELSSTHWQCQWGWQKSLTGDTCRALSSHCGTGRGRREAWKNTSRVYSSDKRAEDALWMAIKFSNEWRWTSKTRPNTQPEVTLQIYRVGRERAQPPRHWISMSWIADYPHRYVFQHYTINIYIYMEWVTRRRDTPGSGFRISGSRFLFSSGIID